MRRQFPWYDSIWLDQYVAAKAFLAQHHPHRLDEFVEALAPLRTRPDFEAQHLKHAVAPEVLRRIQEAMATLKPTSLEVHEIQSFGRWVVHDHPILTELQNSMTALVEDLAQEQIESSYNFLSLYTRLGKCPIHMDAPEAKWTLDICVDQSDPWPIHFSQIQDWPESCTNLGPDWDIRIKSDPSNHFTSHTLQPGEAILFSGSSQ